MMYNRHDRSSIFDHYGHEVYQYAHQPGGAGISGDIKNAYGTDSQPVTISLNLLQDTTARESTAVDNSSNLFLDALAALDIKTGATPSATGYVVIYAYGTSDGGSTYTGGATGSDAGLTVEITLKVLKVLPVTATADRIYEVGPFSIAGAFGGNLPEEWGIVVENQTGDALNASGNSAWYQGVYRTIL